MSQQQIASALERANVTRLARSAAKKNLRKGKISLAEALELDEFQGALIGTVLLAQERWGVERTKKLLRLVQTHETRLVSQLTERQRWLIAELAPLDHHRRNQFLRKAGYTDLI